MDDNSRMGSNSIGGLGVEEEVFLKSAFPRTRRIEFTQSSNISTNDNQLHEKVDDISQRERAPFRILDREMAETALFELQKCGGNGRVRSDAGVDDSLFVVVDQRFDRLLEQQSVKNTDKQNEIGTWKSPPVKEKERLLPTISSCISQTRNR